MNKCIERIVNGIVKENPTFVMLIGMCRPWLLQHQLLTV